MSARHTRALQLRAVEIANATILALIASKYCASEVAYFLEGPATRESHHRDDHVSDGDHADTILVHNWVHNTFGERDYPPDTVSLLALENLPACERFWRFLAGPTRFVLPAEFAQRTA